MQQTNSSSISTQGKNASAPVTPYWYDNRGGVHFGDTLREAKAKAAAADNGCDRYDR